MTEGTKPPESPTPAKPRKDAPVRRKGESDYDFHVRQDLYERNLKGEASMKENHAAREYERKHPDKPLVRRSGETDFEYFQRQDLHDRNEQGKKNKIEADKLRAEERKNPDAPRTPRSWETPFESDMMEDLRRRNREGEKNMMASKTIREQERKNPDGPRIRRPWESDQEAQAMADLHERNRIGQENMRRKWAAQASGTKPEYIEYKRPQTNAMSAEAAHADNSGTININETLNNRYNEVSAKIAANHPEYSPEVVDFVKNAYKVEAVRYSQVRNQITNDRTPNGAPADRAWKRQMLWNADNQAVNNIFNKVKAAYGDEGVKVMRTFNDYNRDPTVIDLMTRQFYHDGLKPGGLVGGAIGGIMAYVMAGSVGGINGWLKIAGIAIAALVGAWAGNSAVDTIGKYVTWGGKKKPPATPEPAREPEQAISKAKEPEMSPIDAAVAKKAQDALKPQPAPSTESPTAAVDVKDGTAVAPKSVPSTNAAITSSGKGSAAPSSPK